MKEKVKTLEDLLSSVRVLGIILRILKKKKRSTVLARSVFSVVFLNGEGFFLREDVTKNRRTFFMRKKGFLDTQLTTEEEILEAIAQVKDFSSPTKDTIVSFIFRDVLRIKKHHKKSKKI